MSQSLTKVCLHITFSTKDRYPFIDGEIEQELWAYIGGVCKALDCNPICVGGYRDHIHVCCLMSRNITQAKLLEEIKKGSSKWIKTKGRKYEKFYWQRGYSMFSVNPSEMGKVAEYIQNQSIHHTKQSFQQELLTFLKKYGVEYDERYLWE
jgi:REP element-mobilizing transposase RayT